MTTNDRRYEMALLADAAYANLGWQAGLEIGGVILRSLLANGNDPRLTVAEADIVVSNYTVVAEYHSTMTGFDAVVFRDLRVAAGQPGRYVMAIQGSASLLQDWFVADGLLTLVGEAIPQVMSLRAFMSQLTTPSSQGGYGLLGPGERIDVTGHSLGGHLAHSLASQWESWVNQAYTFNGANNKSEALLVALRAGAAVLAGQETPYYPANVSNTIAEPGLELVTGTSTGLRLGEVFEHFIEDQTLNPPWGPLSNHSLDPQADGLAAYRSFGAIVGETALQSSSVSRVLAASSNVASLSLEIVSNELLALFPNIQGAGPVPDHDRNQLHGTLDAIYSYMHVPGNNPGGYRLIDLTQLSPAVSASAAQGLTAIDGLAVRRAMVTGTPFVVDTANYAGLFNQDGQYDLANFSTAYLQNRAEYLSALFERNTADSNRAGSVPNGVMYDDKQTGTTLANVGLPDPQIYRQIIFGLNDNGQTQETLTGGYLDDRIFGAGGNDHLLGGAGDDLLDGGAGDDILEGQGGTTLANGGVGRDTYRLSDGDGHLTIRGDDGLGVGGTKDVISIQGTTSYALGSTQLQRLAAGSDVYSDDHGNRFTLVGTTLEVVLAGGRSLSIEDFQSGDFGIDLVAATDMAPATAPGGSDTFNVTPSSPPSGSVSEVGQYPASSAVPFTGWLSPGVVAPHTMIEVVTATNVPGNPWYTISGGMGDTFMTGDAGGNTLVDDVKRLPDGSLIAIDAAVGNDVLHGGGGNDRLMTHGGDDWSYGDDGNDILIDNPANDPNYTDLSWVSVTGNSNRDHLFGGIGTDFLAANGGDAYMEGGDGADELYGGAHGDTLHGGSGDDVLSGDTRLIASPWTVTGSPGNLTVTENLNGILGGETSEYGTDILHGDAGNDTLIGGGGGDKLYGGTDSDWLYGDLGVIPSNLTLRFSNHAPDPLNIQGDDFLWSGAGNDFLYGAGGNDHLYGEDDADFLYGNAGNDYLEGGLGTDYLVGDDSDSDDGKDEIHGGDGDDTLFGMGGSDRLLGDAGVDTLIGGAGDDLLEGGDGDEYLWSDSSIGLFGGAGNDVLLGGAGVDGVQGDDGNDQIDGSTGDDYLWGGAGDDTYRLSIGDGADVLSDEAGISALRFADGVTRRDLVVSANSGSYGTEVFIEYSALDHVQLRVASFNAIGSVSFADGTVMDADELLHQFRPDPISLPSKRSVNLVAGVSAGEVELRRFNDDLVLAYDGPVPGWVNTSNLSNSNVLFEQRDGAAYGLGAGTQVLVLTNWYRAAPNSYVDRFVESGGATTYFETAANAAAATFQGSAGAEVLAGTANADVLRGDAGADIVAGDAGDDDLTGGVDGDLLAGGSGNDTYRVNQGDGADVILDAGGGTDVVRFGPGIVQTDLTVTETSAGLHVQIGAVENGNELLVLNWADGSPASIDQFVFDGGGVLSRAAIDAMNTGNHTPRVDGDLFVRARNNQPFNYTVPAGAITDIDIGDTLVYSATLADGSALPAWLTFNPATLSLSGTPTLAGNLDLSIYASDSAGLSNALSLQIGVMGLLNGTGGADNLTAPGPGGMEVHGLAGNDVLYGAEGGDELFGEDGDDNLEAMGGDDYLAGGAGVDYLAGGDGDDFVDAGTGNDYLRGDAGVNVLIGGPGNDYFADGTFAGHVSSNTLRIGLGDGSDYTATDALDADDTIEFGSGITAAFVRANMWFDSNGALVLRYNPNAVSDQLLIAGNDWFAGDDVGGPDTVVTFAGGETCTLEDFFAQINQLTAGDDTYIARGAGPFHAMAGNDLVLYQGAENYVEIHGEDGDDYLVGHGLTDGGNGNDSVFGSGTLTGGAGNDVLQGGPESVDVLDGGPGDDTYWLQGSWYGGLDTVVEGAGGGIDTVQVEESYTLGAELENLIMVAGGSASLTGNELDNSITGGSSNDTLSGGAGNDTLDGAGGSDTMNGGVGNDTYVVGSTTDVVTEYANEGSDTVLAAITCTLVSTIENLTLTGNSAISGTGNALDNILTGNSKNNTLMGDAGNDTLDGGSAGTDVLVGGIGNDTYVVARTSGITITENANEGTDLVQASVTHTLGSNLENLTLTGSAAINGTGNSLANVITGNGANNTLSGGTGVDTLIGGPGNDTYTVDNGGDLITELAGEGLDLVNASVTHTLASHVESLTLTGSSALNATGNDLDNALTGNSGNNTLTGGAGNDVLSGGSGNDTTVGGQGDDTHVVAQTGDIVTEAAGEGVDLVQSSITCTLGSNVENLTLTGTSAINGTGNTLDNVLTGNSKNNTLTGNVGNDTLDGGTAGTDVLRGGAGNDTYIVARTSGITLTENANEGTDLVQASVTCTLGNNLENLLLTGTSAINGTGNAVNNTLTGNGAANTLSGGTGADVLVGNAGNDTLTGGNGADTYQYASGDGADVVSDAGTDGATDLLGFTNLVFSQVTLARATNDLLISRNGSTTDSVRVSNWFTVTGNQIETVQFTDQTLTNAQINSLIGGGSYAAAIDPELERGFLSLLSAINGFESRGDVAAADWSARPTEEATLGLAMNPVDPSMVRGSIGRGQTGHSACHLC